MAITLSPGILTPHVIGGAGAAVCGMPFQRAFGTGATIDAANEALIFCGQWYWEDGGSHTIDTTSSSRVITYLTIGTLANASTTVRVGLAALNTTAGVPARAAHASNVISFDVYWQGAGNGGVLATGINELTPTNGTKTIASGDFVAFAVQMTARAGADSISALFDQSGGTTSSRREFPCVTSYLGGTYAAAGADALVSAVAVASDGTVGTFFGGFWGGASTTTFNSASTPDELGNVFTLPYPVKIVGAQLQGAVGGALDVVCYTDPLGTPVAAATTQILDDYCQSGSIGLMNAAFASPVSIAASTPFALIAKPNATNAILGRFAPGNSNILRVTSFTGNCYGVSRTDGSGAFSAVSGTSYQISAIVSHFDNGVSTSPVAALKSFGRGAPY